MLDILLHIILGTFLIAKCNEKKLSNSAQTAVRITKKCHISDTDERKGKNPMKYLVDHGYECHAQQAEENRLNILTK